MSNLPDEGINKFVKENEHEGNIHTLANIIFLLFGMLMGFLIKGALGC